MATTLALPQAHVPCDLSEAQPHYAVLASLRLSSSPELEYRRVSHACLAQQRGLDAPPSIWMIVTAKHRAHI